MNNSQIPNSAAAITPSDTLNQHGLGLWVGGAGNVSLKMSGVGTVTLTAVPAGTTATNLIRFW